MTFKEFLKLEDGKSSETGLFVNIPTPTKKPSDGQPFKDFTNSFAGSKGSTSGPGASRKGGPMMGAPNLGSGMFMKKQMKKQMKKH